MAKKKSTSNREALSSDNPNVREQSDLPADAPIAENIGENVNPSDASCGDCAETMRENDDLPKNPADSDITETINPDGCGDRAVQTAEAGEDNGADADARRATGEILRDDAPFADDQMMGRLRASALAMIELYREAQLFASQNFNVASMVLSNEPCLVQNTIEIARILNLWIPESVAVLTAADARSRDIAGQYILACMKSGIAPVVDTVTSSIEKYHAADGEEKEYISNFLEKLRILLVNLTAQDREEPSEPQRALSRLCGCFDVQTVERMLCDPDASVRIAVVRSLAARGDVSANTLLVALILLKDRNEKVNEAVVKLCAKIKSYPEIVLPQVLPLLPSADRELREAIADLLRTYADDAVEPVMSALEDTRETMFDAAVQAISLSPQRYTDALLAVLQSPRAREFVRTRAAQILRHHRDATRQGDISAALGLYEQTPSDEYPQWQPPKTQVRYAPSATDNADFYKRLLTDEELSAFSKHCDESAVLRLMADASEFAQINAMKAARMRGEVSAVALENISVWLRCENTALAQTAADTWFAVHPDKVAAVGVILDALRRVGAQDIQKYYLEKIRCDQAVADALFEIYFARPRLAAPAVRYLLSHDPSPKTADNLCAGIRRDQTVACIAETIDLLAKFNLPSDNRKLRPVLVSLLKDPVSFGQYGLVARLRAIALLQKYLKADDDPGGDRETISALQALCKSSKNSEIRNRIKELLKSVGEEIFDFDDEDDDFEDLGDDD